MRTETFDNFPTWAITYCAYADASALEDEDIKDANEWMEKNHLSELIDVSEQTGFSHYPAFGKACDVCKATFILTTK